MEVQEFLSLAKRRRMVREYAHDAVPQKAILNILDAARWAPSGYNLQPWQFIVVDEEEQKGRLVQVVEHEAARAKQQGHDVRVPNYLSDVPVFIAVVSDPRMKQKLPSHRTGPSADKIYLSSVSAAIQNMHLAAAAQGLGTVWFTVSSEEETQSELRMVLNVPAGYEILYLIPVGYPAKPIPEPGLDARHCLENIVHWNRFGGL